MHLKHLAALLQDGRGDFYHRAQMKRTCLEDWYATMDMILPGRTDEGKRHRMMVTEGITGVRSKSRFESYDVNQLQQCVGILMCLEHRLKTEPAASTKP